MDKTKVICDLLKNGATMLKDVIITDIDFQDDIVGITVNRNDDTTEYCQVFMCDIITAIKECNITRPWYKLYERNRTLLRGILMDATIDVLTFTVSAGSKLNPFSDEDEEAITDTESTVITSILLSARGHAIADKVETLAIKGDLK